MSTPDRFIYWPPASELERGHSALEAGGFATATVSKTPCQVLEAEGDRVWVAPPEIWSGMCGRQGSWYRASGRAGQTLPMSAPPARAR